jgi:hypothetical protein
VIAAETVRFYNFFRLRCRFNIRTCAL